MRSVTFCSGGGTSPLAMRTAKPSTTAVLPTPASPTRIGIVLPAARENVHHLPDLEIASQHRVDLARFGAAGEVDGELIQVRRLAAGRGTPAPCPPSAPAAVST